MIWQIGRLISYVFESYNNNMKQKNNQIIKTHINNIFLSQRKIHKKHIEKNTKSYLF